MRAMLVAAGFGTRLDPLTRELPKPALPVGNRPIAAYALEHLARSGVSDIVVNTHHLGDELWRALEPCCPDGTRLTRVHEAHILGTGGGVRNAWRPSAGEDFVVVNAKVLFAFDLERALSIHRKSSAIATMIVQPLPAGAAFAPVEIDAESRVRTIRGLPASSVGLTRCLFTGVQILSARAHRDLPESGDVIEHTYLPWLERGEHVQAVIDDAPFRDVGVSLATYLDANLALATGALPWPGIAPAPNSVLAAPTAFIPNSAHLDQVVLGEHTRIDPNLHLSRIVTWQNAHLRTNLQNTIITSKNNIIPVPPHPLRAPKDRPL